MVRVATDLVVAHKGSHHVVEQKYTRGCVRDGDIARRVGADTVVQHTVVVRRCAVAVHHHTVLRITADQVAISSCKTTHGIVRPIAYQYASTSVRDRRCASLIGADVVATDGVARAAFLRVHTITAVTTDDVARRSSIPANDVVVGVLDHDTLQHVAQVGAGGIQSDEVAKYRVTIAETRDMQSASVIAGDDVALVERHTAYRIVRRAAGEGDAFRSVG